MQISKIEQLDKSRSDLLRWATVSWAFWYGSFILRDWVTNTIVLGIIFLVEISGSALWIFTCVKIYRIYRLGRLIQTDVVLSHTFNDELHIHNRNKALAVAYFTTLFLVGAFMAGALFLTIPTLLALQVILYMSVLSGLIASLIYNRAG